MLRGVMKTSQVVGESSNQVWAQVGSEADRERTVLALVVVSYGGESDVLDLSEVGIKTLEEIKLIGKRARTLHELDKQLLSVEPPVADIKMALGVVVLSGRRLMVAATKGVETYLRRDKTLARLHIGGNPGVVGEGRGGDTVVMATQGLVEQLGEGKWQELLAQGLLMQEELAVAVHGLEDSSQVAAVMGELPKEASAWRRRLAGLLERPLVVREQTRRVNTYIGGGLLLLLLVGIGVGVVRRQISLEKQGIETLNKSVETGIEEARAAAELDSERANYLLAQARNTVGQFLAQNKDEERQGSAEVLYGKIDKAEAEMFHRLPVDANILLEYSVLDPNLTGGVVAQDEDGNALLASQAEAEVVGVNLEDRSSWKVEAGPYKDIAEYDGKLYGLKADGVYVSDKKKGGEQRVIEADEEWQDPTYIGIYGGNVYVLDRGAGEIWKYASIERGYGARKRWFGPGITLDLTYVADMWIDGDIWIVTSSGKIERYSRGVPVTLETEGLPYLEKDKLAMPVAVVTTDKEVYILEAGAKRVIVLARDSGKYLRQYANDLFGGGKQLLVEGTRGYVMTVDKVLWFQL